MKWTSEPPKVEGRYRVRGPIFPATEMIAFFVGDDLFIGPDKDSAVGIIDLTGGLEFRGPIPEPEDE